LLAVDVDSDGDGDVFDLLALVTYIVANGPSSAIAPLPADNPKFYFDVNADGQVNAFDILAVVTYVVANPAGGEGPATPDGEADDNDWLLALIADDIARQRRTSNP
jgi:hypothetical protein